MTKDDQGKLRFDLIPGEHMRTEAEIFTYGADKYGDNNWRDIEWTPAGAAQAVERFYAAAMRHIVEWRETGVWRDYESGLAHLAHARWNLGAIIYVEENLHKACPPLHPDENARSGRGR